jgi:Cu+-exporting ATPase
MDMSGKVVAVSGTTSTAAMISCCAHYLTNILPVVGAAGAVALVAQYQIELFWFGLACNLAGILYMGNRVVKFSKAHAAN